jgi:SnoaL-like domain
MTDSDVLTRMLQAIDALDWTTVRRALADEVRLDDISLSGGKPETLAADDLIARWQGLLRGYAVTQHLTGPVLLTDDGRLGVRADAHVRAYHRLPGPTAARPGRCMVTTSPGWQAEGSPSSRLRSSTRKATSICPRFATQRATTSPRRSVNDRSYAVVRR